MTIREAAARAIDAGTVAAQAVNDYGLNSPEAGHALTAAVAVTQEAEAQGCTKADFTAEQARRR